MIAEVPKPAGADRVEPGPGAGLWLETAAAKGWVARSPAGPTSAEHPGTSVVWEDERYEVLAVEELPGGRVRYLLAPWDERHVIRVSDRYDAESEVARAGVRSDTARRLRIRAAILLAAPVTGLAPTVVQEGWEREYAVPPARLTILSTILPFVFGFLSLFALLAETYGSLYSGVSSAYSGGGGSPIVPGGILLKLFGIYLFVEANIRFATAVSTGRGCGSLLGTVPYLLWCRATRKTPEKPAPSYDEETARAAADLDGFRMREPLFGFLSVGDQNLAAERFGFEPIRWGRIGAYGTLVLTVLQAAVSWSEIVSGAGHLGSVPPFLLGVGLSVEQVGRLRTLARGQPAPSVLRHLFRPLCRRLLDAPRSPSSS